LTPTLRFSCFPFFPRRVQLFPSRSLYPNQLFFPPFVCFILKKFARSPLLFSVVLVPFLDPQPTAFFFFFLVESLFTFIFMGIRFCVFLLSLSCDSVRGNRAFVARTSSRRANENPEPRHSKLRGTSVSLQKVFFLFFSLLSFR